MYGAETWMLRAADQKYLESFEMWCWRRMEKISWTNHVRNEEVLLRVNEQRNIFISFKTFFYTVRHLDSSASYLPTGLHLGFFRS